MPNREFFGIFGVNVCHIDTIILDAQTFVQHGLCTHSTISLHKHLAVECAVVKVVEAAIDMTIYRYKETVYRERGVCSNAW